MACGSNPSRQSRSLKLEVTDRLPVIKAIVPRVSTLDLLNFPARSTNSKHSVNQFEANL